MAGNGHQPPNLGTLATRMARTGMGLLRNRAELFALEWEEERVRILELVVWGIGLVVSALMAMILVTATIIFLVPEDYRVYVAAGFAVLYLAGAVVAFVTLKSLLKAEAFSESLRQVKMDHQWLDSLK